MRRVISRAALFLGVIVSSPIYAQEKNKQEMKSAEQIVQEYVIQIKEQDLPSAKRKKLSELIDLVNKEFTKNSNVVTEILTKILEKNSKVADKNLIKEKDDAEAIYNKWIAYKVALQPTYDLFIEKKDNYHCDAFSEEIWKNFTPIAPQSEKIELDAYTKKAIETSIEIAEELCKFAAEL